MDQFNLFKDHYPTLVSLKVSIPVAYIWLRQVHGTNLNQHCAKCLISDRDPRFSYAKKSYSNLDLRRLSAKDPKAYYLCIGHESYSLADNYHLAFKYKEGSTIEDNRLGVSVKINNAARINFSKSDINFTHPTSTQSKFNSCRNYQFAHWFYNRYNL